MLRFEDALERLLALGTHDVLVEDVPLELCDGRVLARNLAAAVDLPGFDYSSMDGYALRASDLEATRSLPVRGESRTGAAAEPLTAGTAMRIFTGAPLPDGADTVVMQETVERDGETATFTKAPRCGQNVRRRGDDLGKGTLAAAKGTRLRPAHLALAASLDLAELPVAVRPTVAIVATGDELRRPGSAHRPGAIPESNTVVLRATARRAGALAEALPYVPDDRAATERAFAAALEHADVLVTIGGVSVGDHDLVRPALESVGVELDFWRVAMKPGKPLAVGRYPRAGRRDAIVLGLPGNPASAFVTFTLFGVPLLRALQGDAVAFPRSRRARSTRAIAHEPGRLEFARATTRVDEAGHLTVTTFDNQASGAITTMAASDALAMIPSERGAIVTGEEIDVLALADLCG